MCFKMSSLNERNQKIAKEKNKKKPETEIGFSEKHLEEVDKALELFCRLTFELFMHPKINANDTN